MDPREFTELIQHCQEAPGSADFSILWAMVQPMIEREVRRISALGPFAKLEEYRIECMQAVAVRFFEDLPRLLDRWENYQESDRKPPPVEAWLRTVIYRMAVDWVRRQPEVVRRNGKSKEHQDNRYERRFEDKDVDQLLTAAFEDQPMDVMVMRMRVREVVAWARANLPRDERLALHDYLLNHTPQSKPVRRALEKLRRHFRRSEGERP